MFRYLTDPLLTILYPQSCRSCGRSVEKAECGVACEACWDATTVFTGSEVLCARCGEFHSAGPAPGPTFCRRCDDHHYDRAAAVGLYHAALAAVVLNLKREPHVPRRLRDLMLRRLDAVDLPVPDLIVPVPLSRKRRFERGFNQAEVIARSIGAGIGRTVDANSLLRVVHTPVHRAGMDRKARAKTVAKAFEARRRNLLEGCDVLLVDDVMTSGATASACAGALKAAGARRVCVFTAAKSVVGK